MDFNLDLDFSSGSQSSTNATTKCDPQTTTGVAGERTRGLAPRDALDWLRLQHVFAWSPQVVTECLDAGASPNEILLAAASGAWRGSESRESSAEPAVRCEPSQGLLMENVKRLDRAGARVVPCTDPGYPESLGVLQDAPPVLLVNGDPEALSTSCIAIVGARAATESARRTARRLARELASAGLTIVSGLARGIDAAAHRGALDVGGRTIAVLACGIDQVYPPEHRALADEIAVRGAVMTEMPVGTSPRRSHFPLRNRLISGLSRGVVVAEARERSGSLITVRHALSQGREVFVVPGSVEGPFAAGSNSLLREGARAVSRARDVLEDLGWDAAEIQKERANRLGTAPKGKTAAPKRPDSSTPADQIVALLSSGPASREAVAMRLNLEPGVFARALLELELADRVIEDRGGQLELNWA